MSESPHTLIALFADAASGPDRPMLAERDGRGAWRYVGSHALRARVGATALGLRATGVRPGDRVAIMSPNRVDWIVAHLAIVHAGAIAVPLYAAQAHDHVRHILAHSGARLLLVDSVFTRTRLEASAMHLPRIMTFDADPGNDLAALEAAGSRAAEIEPGALAAIAADLGGDDVAVLIYTSGTTGEPKGVLLTHRNIASNATDAFALIADVIRRGDSVLSILPYAHIYESTNLYGYFLRGLIVYVNTDMNGLLEDMRSVQPALVLAVPRVFERVLTGIIAKAKSAGGVRARLVPWALATGREYMRKRSTGKTAGTALTLRYRVAYRLALKRIKPLLGLNRLAFFGSGSAPLHPDTAFTFMGFGVSISEGYGLTECSPVVTVNSPLQPVIGSVGPVIPHVDVKLAEDGELLVRGPGVMKGYYRDPDATGRTITDGWFHTGDIATIGADGCVRIIDRKNELFKTSGGKYIAPARIESALLRSIYFNQTMVFGAGRAHPSALISPNWNSVRSELHLAPDAPVSDLAQRRDVMAFLQIEAQRQTSDLAPFEQIRSVVLLTRDLTIEAGELSPTQKIRRRIVEHRFTALIDAGPTVIA
jgi:long-chain acyl-CoA synthetase